MIAKSNQDHPLHASIVSILKMREAPEFSITTVSGSDDYTFARDKVFAIVQALNDLLVETPPELTSTHALNQLQNHIQAPLNELTAFIGNKNPGHITNAATQLEQNVLPLFWGFTPFVQKTAETTFPAILKSQSEAARIAVAELDRQRGQLAIQLAALQAEATGVEEKLEEVKSGAATERAQAAAAVAKFDQTFTERETARQAEFESVVSDLRTAIGDEVKDLEDKADKLIEALETHRDNAARIVQVVGNIGVTGNYQQIANKESKQANLWRWITVGIFALGLTVAGATFLKFWSQPLTPETGLAVLVRLLYAVAITAPAWYTARESARHRTNADRARQTELELSSIGPFIELMPEDKKNEIRERLTPFYFGRPVEPHTVTHPLDPSIIKDTTVEVVKAIKH